MAVTHFQVLRRSPFAGGQPFGAAGPYERIDALASFAVDPDHPLNAGIADLGLAPRDASGRVHFEADIVLLRPATGRGNGNLLASVVNRGRTAIVPFSFPPPGFVPTIGDAIEPGDGFLLNRGFTVALCGWQWDVVRRPGALGLAAPLALEPDGRPAETDVKVRFQPLTRRQSEYLGHWPTHPDYHPDRVHHAYPAASLEEPDAALTRRTAPSSPAEVLPRGAWRFARAEDGVEAADATWITLVGGFEPGVIYELTYRTARCPIAGAGLLAIRDMGSFLRYCSAADGNPAAGTIAHTFVHGVSQTGRFLREFLHTGCNVDEESRQVFDGVFVQIAGARRGEFNFRGAQPSAQYGGNGLEPPYAYTPTSQCGEGLIDRQRERGGLPRIFEVNTANEYWRSDAMLVHFDPWTGEDLAIPEDVRVYLLAGCQHGPGIPFLSDRSPLTPEQRAGNNLSILNYTPVTRAALVNLVEWVTAGREPPPNAVPSLAAGTAVERDDALAAVAAVPGAALPDRTLLPSTRVPRVDADGNDIAGIRLPELEAPLATCTGWNTRHPETGAPGELADMLGSTFPFARTAEERKRSGDRRPSLAERYRDQGDYEAKVRAGASRLASERSILAEDVERVVESAGRLYARLTRP